MQFDWIYLPQYFFNWLTDLQAQAGNIGFDWAFIPQHFFDAPLLQGAAMTIFISVVAQFFGIILGLIAALMKMSKNPILRGIAGFARRRYRPKLTGRAPRRW